MGVTPAAREATCSRRLGPVRGCFGYAHAARDENSTHWRFRSPRQSAPERSAPASRQSVVRRRSNDPGLFSLAQCVRWVRAVGIWAASTARQAITDLPALQRAGIKASQSTGRGKPRTVGAGLGDITHRDLAVLQAADTSSPSLKTAASLMRTGTRGSPSCPFGLELGPVIAAAPAGNLGRWEVVGAAVLTTVIVVRLGWTAAVALWSERWIKAQVGFVGRSLTQLTDWPAHRLHAQLYMPGRRVWTMRERAVSYNLRPSRAHASSTSAPFPGCARPPPRPCESHILPAQRICLSPGPAIRDKVPHQLPPVALLR